MTDGSAALTREQLLAAILEFISGDDLLPLEDVRAALAAEIDAAGPAALIALRERLTADHGWSYYPPDPLARRIHHVLAHRFVRAESAVLGTDALDAIGDAPALLLSNHLSYADANVIEVLLARAGARALADRLTAIAGPKVFTSRQRRFSSLCFGAVKVPQSAQVSSGEAGLRVREVARAAREALAAAAARLEAGDALLLFPEGTRSRTGAMSRLLAGAARYLDLTAAWLVPIGLTGPEALFPIDAAGVHPARVEMRIGVPLRVDSLRTAVSGDRRRLMDAAGLAIADLLPPHYRGAYADAAAFVEARAVLDRTRAEV
jgi:1-acyl-sn-glycerol-3-phosphate acyltransferase